MEAQRPVLPGRSLLALPGAVHQREAFRLRAGRVPPPRPGPRGRRRRVRLPINGRGEGRHRGGFRPRNGLGGPGEEAPPSVRRRFGRPAAVKGDSFDAIIADGVLHHIKVQGILEEGISEAARLLRRGGRLCAFDRNGSLLSRALLVLFVALNRAVRLWKPDCASSATGHECSLGREDRG